MSLAHGDSLGTGNASQASTVSLSTAVAASSNSKLLLSVSGYVNTAGAANPSVSVGGGLTWTRRAFAQGLAAANYFAAIFTADAASGLASGTTLTVDATSAVSGFCIGGVYLTGADVEATSTDTNGTASGTGAGSRSVTVSLTTTNAADYIYYHAASDFGNGDSWTPNTNYTSVATWGQAADDFGANNGYRIVAASGAQSPGSTKASPGGPAFGAAVAIKEASGGGGGTTVHLLSALGAGT